MKLSSLLFLLSICLFNVQTLACRCRPLTISESYAQTNIIVKATIIKAEELSGKEINKYTAITSYIYKGVTTSDTITIYSSKWGPSCGIRLSENYTYIIYASPHVNSINQDLEESPNTFHTTHCSRTEIYDEVEDRELKKLQQQFKIPLSNGKKY